MAILLTSLLFVFEISLLPKYSVNYYDYIIKWCFGILSRSDLFVFVFTTVIGLLLVVAVECHYIILEYLSGSLNRIEVASFGFNHFINGDVY